MPLFFEDLHPGLCLRTPGRVITEDDVTAFASLTGDDNPIHTDAEFAKTTPFGQRIAHGLLGLSIILGLASHGDILKGSVLAFREIVNWKFVKPVFFGDTLRAELEVRETRDLPGMQAGMVSLHIKVRNQHDETVMKGVWKALIRKKEGSA